MEWEVPLYAPISDVKMAFPCGHLKASIAWAASLVQPREGGQHPTGCSIADSYIVEGCAILLQPGEHLVAASFERSMPQCHAPAALIASPPLQRGQGPQWQAASQVHVLQSQ